jgi:hypothetical protein
VNLDALICEQERYFVFFPVAAAKRKKIIDAVGNFSVPAWAQGMPVMRKLLLA